MVLKERDNMGYEHMGYEQILRHNVFIRNVWISKSVIRWGEHRHEENLLFPKENNTQLL